MTVDDQSADSLRFKDRSTGLILFGTLQIVMGGCCALLIPFMLLSLLIAPMAGAPTNARMMIPAIGLYGLLAVALVWLGIGSILARRWARALTLTLAWLWLVIGVMALIMVSVWMPNMFDMAAAQGQPAPPPEIMIVVQVMMLGMMVCLYLVLPGMFVLFYRSPHVKATCEFKDPLVRWTDSCPLPVLALSLLLGSGAISMVYSLAYCVLPFFGILLKGVPGGLAILCVSLLFAYLAWATYKLKMGAWWATLAVYGVFCLSTVVTFSRISIMEFYREMNFPEEQLKLMEDSGMVELMNMPLMTGVGFAVLVGYMLCVRRYFVAGAAAQVKSSRSGCA